MKINLPTGEEINVHDSLDEREACKHFLGKTLEEAEKLFQKNALYYIEDLMWMGPTAFQFYASALIRYIKSPESQNDADAINCFISLLEFRFKYECLFLVPIAKHLVESCIYITNDYARFDIKTEIYGDLRPRYQKMIQQLNANS